MEGPILDHTTINELDTLDSHWVAFLAWLAPPIPLCLSNLIQPLFLEDRLLPEPLQRFP